MGVVLNQPCEGGNGILVLFILVQPFGEYGMGLFVVRVDFAYFL